MDAIQDREWYDEIYWRSLLTNPAKSESLSVALYVYCITRDMSLELLRIELANCKTIDASVKKLS
jgi:hypothetical protein